MQFEILSSEKGRAMKTLPYFRTYLKALIFWAAFI